MNYSGWMGSTRETTKKDMRIKEKILSANTLYLTHKLYV